MHLYMCLLLGLIAFHASLERSRYRMSSDVKFDKIDFGDGLNNKTSVFTAPKKVYTNSWLQFYLLRVRPEDARQSRLILRKEEKHTHESSLILLPRAQVSKTVLVLLNKGETVNLKVVSCGGRGNYKYTTFGGYLVRPL